MRAVQEAAILLKASQAVACTGQTLLHRFFCKRSTRQFPLDRVAATCVFLACKLEENSRKLRDVVNVFLRMVQREKAAAEETLSRTARAEEEKEKEKFSGKDEKAARGEGETYSDAPPIVPPIPDTHSREHDEFRADVIRIERHALREFGFCVHVEHPHKFVLNVVRMFEQSEALMQKAWSFANDSLRTNLCVRFRADKIAAACVHLAARTSHVALPEDVTVPDGRGGHASQPWYALFDVDDEQMAAMCESILALYEYLPPGGRGSRARGGDAGIHPEDPGEKLIARSSPPPPGMRFIPGDAGDGDGERNGDGRGRRASRSPAGSGEDAAGGGNARSRGGRRRRGGAE